MSYTVYFDLETGGVEMRHPVIQMAAIAVDDATGLEAGTFERKLTFAIESADPEALKVNRFTREAWIDAIAPSAAVTAFSKWLTPFSSITKTSQRGIPYSIAKLAGYNAVTFDMPRLKALYASTFFPCSYQVRDVMQRAFWWFDERGIAPDDFKLTTVCRYFHIPTDGAHDALTDVRLTIALAKALKETTL